jgi:uncharacterized membrane protein
VVGVISLTEARSSTIIAVGISVTTIPTASDIGVSVAFGSWTEAWGSAVQLALNVSVLTAVATLGLPAQQALWQRAIRRSATRLPIRAQWVGSAEFSLLVGTSSPTDDASRCQIRDAIDVTDQ